MGECKGYCVGMAESSAEDATSPESAQSAYMTLLPLILKEATMMIGTVAIPSPWGAPLVMGATGVSPDGDPLLILMNETPVNFMRTARPLDDPDKWQLEMLHLQRLGVDARAATGSELFAAIEKGSDPPDAIVYGTGGPVGWELTTLSVESRRVANDLFGRVRMRLALQQRHRLTHLAGHMIYMWFGMASQETGLPYRSNDQAAVDQLVDALVAYHPDPSQYTVDVSAGPPGHLPAGFKEAVSAPGDVGFFSTPFLNAVPTTPCIASRVWRLGSPTSQCIPPGPSGAGCVR
jgi:hypothetical protein